MKKVSVVIQDIGKKENNRRILKMTYEEFVEKRRKENCVPVSREEYETGLSSHQLVELYKKGTKI